MMITLLNSPTDRPLADRIAADLRAAGATVTDSIQAGRQSVVVALLSPDSVRDAAFLHALDAANDFGQNTVAVLAKPVELPKNLNHFAPIDFSGGYPLAELRAQVDALSGDKPPFAVRMHTSKVRASNRRAGFVLIGLVLFLFVVGSILIIMFDIESPEEEYQAVDTEVALTRDFMIGPTLQFLATALPRSTEQAQAFPETLEAVSTAIRPFFGATATRMNEQLQQFEIAPGTTATPDAGE